MILGLNIYKIKAPKDHISDFKLGYCQSTFISGDLKKLLPLLSSVILVSSTLNPVPRSSKTSLNGIEESIDFL